MAPINVTFATPEGAASMISVEPTSTVSSISTRLQTVLSVPVAEQVVSYNGVALRPDQTFASAQVSEGDLILVERVQSGAAGPGAGHDAGLSQALLRTLRQDPAMLAQIRSANPALYDAIMAGNADLVSDLFAAMQASIRPGGAGTPQQAVPNDLDVDPMSADAQERIAEHIRMENVARNFADAIEHNPESFAQVVMLFVDVKVNGHPTTAFVDSGAQATIISKACAERCGILRLLDTRFSGIARGVGTATIFGRIHLAILDVADQYFEVSFTVMEDPSYDMLLGLDMLRKHRACIDLTHNCLRIGGASTPFLPEHKIPTIMRSSDDQAGSDAAITPSTGQNFRSPTSMQPPVAAAASNDRSRAVSLEAAEQRLNRSKIEKLVTLGFSEQESEQALRACGGNEEQAAAMLTQAKYGI